VARDAQLLTHSETFSADESSGKKTLRKLKPNEKMAMNRKPIEYLNKPDLKIDFVFTMALSLQK
jgi:hypothetical protein